jgi:hypothetical protein
VRQIGFLKVAFPLVSHTHVTSKGEHRNHILRAISALPAKQGATEANREAQYLNAAASGNQEVAVLVHGHDDSECGQSNQ